MPSRLIISFLVSAFLSCGLAECRGRNAQGNDDEKQNGAESSDVAPRVAAVTAAGGGLSAMLEQRRHEPSGLKLSDAEIARLLIGKWQGSDPVTGVTGTLLYLKDGTFKGEGTVTLADGDKIRFQAEGKWKVSEGALYFTITKSTRPGVAPVGIEVKETIHALNETVVRYTRGLGKVKERTRVKD